MGVGAQTRTMEGRGRDRDSKLTTQGRWEQKCQYNGPCRVGGRGSGSTMDHGGQEGGGRGIPEDHGRKEGGDRATDSDKGGQEAEGRGSTS